MPSGYTVDVANGKITTLSEFALCCARGMGALIMMRDDPWDAPIPERFEPSRYHADKLDELGGELLRLRSLTPEQAVAEAEAERGKVQRSNKTYRVEKAAEAQRYRAMLAKVEAWEGAPEGIKEFMLSQLRESVRFDGGDPYQVPLPPADGTTWRADKLEEVEKDIAYHAKEHDQDVQRTELRNAWIAQLRASLSKEPHHD